MGFTTQAAREGLCLHLPVSEALDVALDRAEEDLSLHVMTKTYYCNVKQTTGYGNSKALLVGIM